MSFRTSRGLIVLFFFGVVWSLVFLTVATVFFFITSIPLIISLASTLVGVALFVISSTATTTDLGNWLYGKLVLYLE
jgi:hypothetical protein